MVGNFPASDLLVSRRVTTQKFLKSTYWVFDFKDCFRFLFAPQKMAGFPEDPPAPKNEGPTTEFDYKDLMNGVNGFLSISYTP